MMIKCYVLLIVFYTSLPKFYFLIVISPVVTLSNPPDLPENVQINGSQFVCDTDNSCLDTEINPPVPSNDVIIWQQQQQHARVQSCQPWLWWLILPPVKGIRCNRQLDRSMSVF